MVDAPRVLIVADDPLTRAGLSALLSAQLPVTGQVASADLAASISVYAPDVIVWEMGWLAVNAIERLAGLDDLTVPVVALLTDESNAIEAWTAGARGLFLRSTRIESVIGALEAITHGLVVIDPALAGSLFARRERTFDPLIEDLTARESEVLQTLAQGLPNKVIAQRLSISESTVKFHVNAIMSKLGAQSRTDAVVRATRQGLIIL